MTRPLVVAITGHRDVTGPEAAFAAARDAILTAFPGRPVTVRSSLAEGADRAALAPWLDGGSASLVAVLPLPRSEYERDFAETASRAAFATLLDRAREVVELDGGPTRTGAYAAAGLRLLEAADALVAVWDGLPARGPGGTAEVVAEARRRGLPIAWVRVDRPPAGARGGASLILERLPAAAGRERMTPP